jgi:Putative metallopeptidase
MFATVPVFAQSDPSIAEIIRNRIDTAALALGNNPRFKGLSPRYRQEIAEFVSGNMLFVLLHELAHAVVSEMAIPVLGKDEDAADSFAATRLLKLGNDFSDQVVANAAKGWFMSDRRDKKEGVTVPFYDAHGLDLQRAYQFVCFLVGANRDKFKKLAIETKLPEDRWDSCASDYRKALNAWEAVLKPHRRAPDEPKTRIDVVYGEGKGRFAATAEIARTMMLLEPVAELTSELTAWPEPFTLEMQSCGFINAAWVAETRKLTLCYELAADFADLYRQYGAPPAKSGACSRADVGALYRACTTGRSGSRKRKSK